MDWSGAPAYCWLLVLLYVCFILNHLACESLGWKTPLQTLNGVTPDISPILKFKFWDEVYYPVAEKLKYDDKPHFPSQTEEAKGRWVGFGETVGTRMTYKILTDDTKKIVYHSCVHLVDEKNFNK